ncbi:MAG: cytochrome P450 [Methylococcaceae bacterium]|nr:cytochrome P450 [Methylococcaceae bacterium]
MAADSQNSIVDRIKAWALDHLDPVFRVLRWVKPILVLNDFALVTRFDHVQEVLARDDIFQVTYREKMERVTAGENFFLGMQNTPRYTRDVSNMRLAVRRDDLEGRIAPFVDDCASQIMAVSQGRIDVPWQLTRLVPTRLVGDYFGVPGWNEAEFADAATSMFQYLFYPDDPQVEETALAAAAKTRSYLDEVIAERKQNRGQHDDVLERCLKMQDSGLPGMTDLDIRNNLIGLIIGAIPTTSKCAVLMLDYLLSRPDLLPDAQAAARADNDALLTQYLLESLRFRAFAPGIGRLAAEDYVVGKGSLRATKIPKGAHVLAATQSAMMDGCKIKSPGQFRLDRPDYQYMHFGYGLHTCFGQYINRVQIPRIAKAVLKRKGLRRAVGDAGQVQSDGPFPVHWMVEFDE